MTHASYDFKLIIVWRGLGAEELHSGGERSKALWGIAGYRGLIAGRMVGPGDPANAIASE